MSEPTNPFPLIDTLRRNFGYKMPRLGRKAYNLFKRFGPKTLHSELFPGITADLDFQDSVQLATWWGGDRFEKPTPAVIKHWLDEGATTFFDIGSNFGFFSYFALSSSLHVRVHSFEPHPKTFALLERIKTTNHLDRLSCWNIGLGDKDEELILNAGVEDLGHTTFGAHPSLPKESHLKAFVRPFGEWRREVGVALPPEPSWVAKIDVEGFELKALEGMREELRARSFKGLVVEINEFTLQFCQTTPDQIFQFLDEVGYRSIRPSEINPSYRDCVNAFFVPKST